MTTKTFSSIGILNHVTVSHRIGLAMLGASLLALGTACGPSGTSSGNSSAAGDTTAPGQISLAVQFELGKRYVHQMDMTYQARMEGPLAGITQGDQDMSQLQEYAVTVVDATPEGGRTLEFEFLRIQSVTKFGGMDNSFDTAEPENESNPNPTFSLAALAEVIGQPVRIVIAPDQTVESITGVGLLKEKILAKASPAVMDMVRSMFTKNYIQNLAIPRGMPSHPVKPGDTWPFQVTEDLGPIGSIVADLQYKFEGMETHNGTQTARLAYSGSIGGRPPKDAGMMGMKMGIKGGDANGEYWFDPAIGRLVDSRIRQTIQVSVEIPQIPAEMLQDGGFGLEVDQKISIKMLRVESVDDTPETADTSAAESASEE